MGRRKKKNELENFAFLPKVLQKCVEEAQTELVKLKPAKQKLKFSKIEAKS